MRESGEPLERAEPLEPVPSVADAWGLLLRSAAVQIRRLRPAPRVTRAPSAAGQRAKVPRVRPRIQPREVLSCLLLLLAIFGSTAGMTWWSWQTLQDRQVHLGGARDLRADREGRSLTDELVQREERALEGSPIKKREPGSTLLERSEDELPGQSGGNVSVDGRIVGGVVVVVMFGGAGLLSRVVLRRYRQRALLADRQAGLLERVELEPRTPVVGQPEEDPLSTPTEEALAPDPAEAAALLALLVEQRQPPPEESLQTVALEPSALISASFPPAGSTSSTAERLELPDSGSVTGSGGFAVGPARPADADRYGVTPEQTPWERIFDRRVSRRLPYVQPGWLWWADQNTPVTVQELSLSGLRCLLSVPPGGAAVDIPSLGDSVRIFFPVNGTTVKAAGHLQLKEQTAAGLQMGLEFVDLPETDAELLRQLLLAGG